MPNYKILQQKHGIDKDILDFCDVGILNFSTDQLEVYRPIQPLRHKKSPESKREIQRWRFLSRSPGKLVKYQLKWHPSKPWKQNLLDTFHEKYWLVHRDPYIGAIYNPHITGRVFFIAPVAWSFHGTMSWMPDLKWTLSFQFQKGLSVHFSTPVDALIFRDELGCIGGSEQLTRLQTCNRTCSCRWSWWCNQRHLSVAAKLKPGRKNPDKSAGFSCNLWHICVSIYL